MPALKGFIALRLVAALSITLSFVSCSSTPEPVVESPVDLDGDGVYQPYDLCPLTPQGAPVNAEGCPADSDGDGVPDYLDECPDTLPGAAACRYGCALVNPIIINLVNDEFDFDKAVLKPEMRTALDGLVEQIKSNKLTIDLTVVGHTDNIGTDEYNMDLSLRRARAVVDYLRENGLQDHVFDQLGKGETEPITGNDTPEGRAKNRRVEVFPHSEKQH